MYKRYPSFNSSFMIIWTVVTSLNRVSLYFPLLQFEKCLLAQTIIVLWFISSGENKDLFTLAVWGKHEAQHETKCAAVVLKILCDREFLGEALGATFCTTDGYCCAASRNWPIAENAYFEIYCCINLFPRTKSIAHSIL